MNKTLIILTLAALCSGPAFAQKLDPSQAHYVKKYKGQPNPPKPEEMLINTEKEPDLKDGFTALLNGNDLEGWTPLAGNCTFEIKDGVVTGTVVKGSPSTYLSSDKEYGDFVFSCEMKWIVNSNSGVMFRAKKKGDKKVTVYGPQAEMEGFTERGWSGGIYGQSCGGWWYPLWLEEHAKVRTIIKKDDWNRLTIKTEGNITKTWVNGEPAALWTNDEHFRGFFSLQVHSGKEGQVQWRNIKVKESK